MMDIEVPLYAPAPCWYLMSEYRRGMRPATEVSMWMVAVARSSDLRMTVAYRQVDSRWTFDAAGNEPLEWEPEWFGPAPNFPPRLYISETAIPTPAPTITTNSGPWNFIPAAVVVDIDKQDAARYRWLRDNMTFYNTAERKKPSLERAAKRIWYHATDHEAVPLDAMVDASIGRPL